MMRHRLLRVGTMGLALLFAWDARSEQIDPNVFGLGSQVREPGEDYRDSFARDLEILDEIESEQNASSGSIEEPLLESRRPGSALNSSRPLSEVSFFGVPDLLTRSRLMQVFEQIRDERFMVKDVLPKEFAPRRISWLYPVEGCYVRASVAAKFVAGLGFPRPAKFFVFGNLKLTSPYSPHADNHIAWRFHVAPMYRAEGQNWVLDPAMNPERPLTVQEWLTKMNVTEDKVKVNVCSTFTYTYNSPCRTNDAVSDRWATKAQPGFLNSEWTNLIKKGFNPEVELGDMPYWKRPANSTPVPVPPTIP